jgi:predicted nucleic acid-binding protein
VPSDLNPVFLDTAYICALVNTRDEWHQAALAWERHLAQSHARLVTTEFVLVEIADALAKVRFRSHASRLISILRNSPLVDVVPVSSNLFMDALHVYETRTDKDWGLTDCISFIVMGERGLQGSMTADLHFVQAGFRALLRETPHA